VPVSAPENVADVAPSHTPAPPGPAQRLLSTATKLFAAQGIRAVGIDQILREASVAKASLYSTYGSKDALVLAYLTDLDHGDRNRWQQAVTDEPDPEARLLAFFDLAIAAAPTRGFRGCLYANAATEYPGIDLAPVREHRQWMHATLTEQLSAMSPDAAHGDLAHRIQLIYDGALVGSKIERTVEPLHRGRALTLELIR
jgi:AcrR family transcriptional regulator